MMVPKLFQPQMKNGLNWRSLHLFKVLQKSDQEKAWTFRIQLWAYLH